MSELKREIKFRAWRVENKTWLDGARNIITLNGNAQYMGPEMTYLDYDAGEVLISQFTGLKDKNGKEIYEGDTNQDGDTLVYSEVHARFGWTDGGYLLHINSDYDEVTGNIYENPELL